MSTGSLRELGLPSGRDEHWKYAPGRLLARRDWWSPPAESLELPTTEALARATLPVAAPVLAFAGGHAVPRAMGGFGALTHGVTLRPLAEVPSLPENGAPSSVRAAALVAATTPGAWELCVGAGVDAGQLQLIHLPATGAGGLMLRIVLGRGARLHLTESLWDDPTTPGGSQLLRWLQVDVREGATLVHAQVQHLPTTTALLERMDVRVERDGHYTALPVTLGAQAAQLSAHVELAGTGATAHWNQLLRVAGSSHLDVHLTITHAAARTTSSQTIRALADGRGRGAFCGKVIMPPAAHGADSAQSIRNLLLSAQAELDTRPQLEIHVDDVKASHGTTTGSLDPQALFYLRSRGLDEQESRRLLTQAFAHDVVGRHPAGALRDWIAARVLP